MYKYGSKFQNESKSKCGPNSKSRLKFKNGSEFTNESGSKKWTKIQNWIKIENRQNRIKVVKEETAQKFVKKVRIIFDISTLRYLITFSERVEGF